MFEECSISVVAISLAYQGGVPDLKQGTWSKDFDGITSTERSYRKEVDCVTFSIMTEAEHTTFDPEERVTGNWPLDPLGTGVQPGSRLARRLGLSKPQSRLQRRIKRRAWKPNNELVLFKSVTARLTRRVARIEPGRPEKFCVSLREQGDGAHQLTVSMIPHPTAWRLAVATGGGDHNGYD